MPVPITWCISKYCRICCLIVRILYKFLQLACSFISDFVNRCKAEKNQRVSITDKFTEGNIYHEGPHPVAKKTQIRKGTQKLRRLKTFSSRTQNENNLSKGIKSYNSEFQCNLKKARKMTFTFEFPFHNNAAGETSSKTYELVSTTQTDSNEYESASPSEKAAISNELFSKKTQSYSFETDLNNLDVKPVKNNQLEYYVGVLKDKDLVPKQSQFSTEDKAVTKCLNDHRRKKCGGFTRKKILYEQGDLLNTAFLECPCHKEVLQMLENSAKRSFKPFDVSLKKSKTDFPNTEVENNLVQLNSEKSTRSACRGKKLNFEKHEITSKESDEINIEVEQHKILLNLPVEKEPVQPQYPIQMCNHSSILLPKFLNNETISKTKDRSLKKEKYCIECSYQEIKSKINQITNQLNQVIGKFSEKDNEDTNSMMMMSGTETKIHSENENNIKKQKFQYKKKRETENKDDMLLSKNDNDKQLEISAQKYEKNQSAVQLYFKQDNTQLDRMPQEDRSDFFLPEMEKNLQMKIFYLKIHRDIQSYLTQIDFSARDSSSSLKESGIQLEGANQTNNTSQLEALIKAYASLQSEALQLRSVGARTMVMSVIEISPQLEILLKTIFRCHFSKFLRDSHHYLKLLAEGGNSLQSKILPEINRNSQSEILADINDNCQLEKIILPNIEVFERDILPNKDSSREPEVLTNPNRNRKGIDRNFVMEVVLETNQGSEVSFEKTENQFCKYAKSKFEKVDNVCSSITSLNKVAIQSKIYQVKSDFLQSLSKNESISQKYQKQIFYIALHEVIQNKSLKSDASIIISLHESAYKNSPSFSKSPLLTLDIHLNPDNNKINFNAIPIYLFLNSDQGYPLHRMNNCDFILYNHFTNSQLRENQKLISPDALEVKTKTKPIYKPLSDHFTHWDKIMAADDRLTIEKSQRKCIYNPISQKATFKDELNHDAKITEKSLIDIKDSSNTFLSKENDINKQASLSHLFTTTEDRCTFRTFHRESLNTNESEDEGQVLSADGNSLKDNTSLETLSKLNIHNSFGYTQSLSSITSLNYKNKHGIPPQNTKFPDICENIFKSPNDSEKLSQNNTDFKLKEIIYSDSKFKSSNTQFNFGGKLNSDHLMLNTVPDSLISICKNDIRNFIDTKQKNIESKQECLTNKWSAVDKLFFSFVMETELREDEMIVVEDWSKELFSKITNLHDPVLSSNAICDATIANDDESPQGRYTEKNIFENQMKNNNAHKNDKGIVSEVCQVMASKKLKIIRIPAVFPPKRRKKLQFSSDENSSVATTMASKSHCSGKSLSDYKKCYLEMDEDRITSVQELNNLSNKGDRCKSDSKKIKKVKYTLMSSQQDTNNKRTRKDEFENVFEDSKRTECQNSIAKSVQDSYSSKGEFLTSLENMEHNLSLIEHKSGIDSKEKETKYPVSTLRKEYQSRKCNQKKKNEFLSFVQETTDSLSPSEHELDSKKIDKCLSRMEKKRTVRNMITKRKVKY